MDLDNRAIAEAFSGHKFEDTFPHLSNDVEWDIVGDRHPAGREAVMAVCRESAEYLGGVKTNFKRFNVIDAQDKVVIDSLADYSGEDGVSTVASCDVYEFADGKVVRITSYNIDLTSD